MAFVFDATISGTSSNSYATVAQADDYFAGTLNSEKWSALSNTVKEQLLVVGTDRLESESYGGYAVDTTQRLQFPRSGLISRYGDDFKRTSGYYPDDAEKYYPTDEIPKEVQTALFELAVYFLDKANDELGTVDEIDLEQLSSYEVGPLSVTIQAGFKVEQLPSKVRRMLVACGPNTWLGSMKPLTAQRG